MRRQQQLPPGQGQHSCRGGPDEFTAVLLAEWDRTTNVPAGAQPARSTNSLIALANNQRLQYYSAQGDQGWP
jgi:hypothetical protein